MKNQYLINIVFAFAIAVVIFLVVKSNKSQNEVHTQVCSTAVDSAGNTVSQQFPVAYIMFDSLMSNYDYFVKREKEYTSATEREGAKLQKQMDKIQQDMYNLQMQYQQGLMTSREAETKNTELQKRYENLMQTQQRKTAEFAQTEKAITNELRDSVEAALAVFNQDKRFKIVLNDMFKSNIFYAEEQLNITEPLLQLLNERYKKSQQK